MKKRWFLVIGILFILAIFLFSKVSQNTATNFTDYFLDTQKALFIGAIDNCYMNSDDAAQTIIFIQDLNKKYLADEITSKEMWTSLDAFNRDFGTKIMVKDPNNTCIPPSSKNSVIESIQNYERPLAIKYYSEKRNIEIISERIKVFIGFDIILKNKLEFRW